MEVLTAKTIMSAPVVTVRPESSVRDAVRLMLDRHISGIPVVESDGRLVGIITEADLLPKEAQPPVSEPLVGWFGHSLWLERLVTGHRKVEGRTAGEVMTHNVVTAEEETPVHVLASRMMRYSVNRLPIVRAGQVVGIVTRADVLKVFLRSDELLEHEGRRLLDDVLVYGEEVGLSVDRGVFILRGVVGSPGRRQVLLRRLWAIDGIVAIDDRDLREAYRETAATWE
jgi:CBS domain-containing protein